MKDKLIIIMMAVLVMFVFTGCATGPIMTEDQSEQIANYSTALLLKYDANYTTRLVDTASIEAERALEEAEEQARIEAEQSAIEASEAAEAEQAQAEEAPVVEDVILDIDDTLGIEGVDIEYSYFELVEQYPEEDEGSFAPVMKTEEGDMLFVVHFTMTNSTSDTQVVSVFDTNATFRLETNEIESRNTFITLLLNDFANFEGTLESGEMVDLVLITEVDGESSTGIDNIYLTIKIDGESFRTKLQ